jgi:hypothetical protein
MAQEPEQEKTFNFLVNPEHHLHERLERTLHQIEVNCLNVNQQLEAVLRRIEEVTVISILFSC